MLSVPDKTKLALAGLLLAATTTIAPGCTRSRATTSERPFADVTDSQRNEATMAVEPGEGAATASPDTSVATAQPDAQAQTTEAALQQQPTPPAQPEEATEVPPSRQPVVVPPTETIRAETPGAAGPATSAVANGGPARYQIVAPVPAIVPTTRPSTATTGLGAGAEIPLAIDEVGLVRQWPVWTAERPSGNIVARPTYWDTDYRERPESETREAFVEPVRFLYNTLLLPYRMIRTAPWTKVTYDPVTPQDEPRAPYEISEQQQQQGQ